MPGVPDTLELSAIAEFTLLVDGFDFPAIPHIAEMPLLPGVGKQTGAEHRGLQWNRTEESIQGGWQLQYDTHQGMAIDAHGCGNAAGASAMEAR